MHRNKITYSQQFQIRASEVDTTQKATLPSICNLLQEIAGNHARELKFDITDLLRDNLTWVLHRLHIEMDAFPRWRETITIKTWPSGVDGVRAHRDFLIYGADENIIGRSISYWLILDIQTRRPNRIPREIIARVPPNREHVLRDVEGSFSETVQADTRKNFIVRESDLDLNRHLNNVRYVEWALACLPENSRPDNIDIKFMAEAVLGDTVTVGCTSSAPPDSRHNFQIKCSSDDKILALAYSS